MTLLSDRIKNARAAATEQATPGIDGDDYIAVLETVLYCTLLKPT